MAYEPPPALNAAKHLVAAMEREHHPEDHRLTSGPQASAPVKSTTLKMNQVRLFTLR